MASLLTTGNVSINANALRAAIIDLDGTLIDTLGDFEAALNATLTEVGLSFVERAFIARTVGRGSEHLIRSTLVQVAGSDARYADAWAAYQRHYPAVNGTQAEVFPGVVEGLQALQARGWPLACLTNKPLAFAQALLVRKGLAGYFAHVFGGDSFARHKPDPLPLLKTCEALGTLPAQTLMVGDSRNDAQAARAAGCPVVLVRYGYNHGEPVEAVGADALVNRLDELAALV